MLNNLHSVRWNRSRVSNSILRFHPSERRWEIEQLVAAFQLVRSSMHSQAANAIRLGCKTAWQNTWFHENPERCDEWKSGQRFQPRQVRKEISTFQTQRRYLYDELSRMAHPNHSARSELASPYAGPKTINVEVLLPVYDLSRIRATLFRLFYAVLLAHLDFDRCHLGFVTDEQRDAYGIQSKSMLRYYDVIKPHLPREMDFS